MENVSSSDIVDYKVTKKHFATTNDKRVLHINIEKDPNLYLRKNKILIRGTIQVKKEYCPCTNWASKLFSKLTVEVESQEVSKNNQK